jgi:hypothetical protein
MTSATSQTAIPVTAPAVGPERPVAWPRRTVRTLANGMQVVLAEQHTFPKVGVELFFRSGNALASRKSPDLAELTSRVIRTGTHSRTSRQIEEDLRRMGASLGTMAGADTSAIAISGLSEFAGKLLAMVDDLARNAAFPADEFERERRQSNAPRLDFSPVNVFVACSSASIHMQSSRPLKHRSKRTSAIRSRTFIARIMCRRTRC